MVSISTAFNECGRSRGLARRALRFAVCGGLALMVAAATIQACDTPVYRFAMYNWLPASYQVYYLHDGTSDPMAAEANRALVAAAENASSPLNLEFAPLDISDVVSPSELPRGVQSYLDTNSGTELPAHVILSPRGDLMHSGRLEADDVNTFFDSPARRRLAEFLDAGSTGVLVLLLSGNEEADARARSAADEVVRRAAAGEITPFTLGVDDAIAGIEFNDLAATGQNASLDVAMLEITSDDAAERWLVRNLLAVEPDLESIDGPMVFGVYGRARAMEPYIGAGISADNLAACVAFIAGACSCEVKEQNPGLDLLVAWDWESAAWDMAARMGEEEGNESFLTAEQVLPSVIGGGASVFTTVDEDPHRPGRADADAAALGVRRAGESSSLLIAQDSRDAPRATAAPRDALPTVADREHAFGRRFLQSLGLGVGLAVAALALASVLIFRMRSGG